jgi:predicted RNA-binding Zn-ribbon protein involved in translation (DUF1610 family)
VTTLGLKSEITGETCYCYNCGTNSFAGEAQESTVIVSDYDLDGYETENAVKYKCPKCGSDMTEFQLHVKISVA